MYGDWLRHEPRSHILSLFGTRCTSMYNCIISCTQSSIQLILWETSDGINWAGMIIPKLMAHSFVQENRFHDFILWNHEKTMVLFEYLLRAITILHHQEYWKWLTPLRWRQQRWLSSISKTSMPKNVSNKRLSQPLLDLHGNRLYFLNQWEKQPLSLRQNGWAICKTAPWGWKGVIICNYSTVIMSPMLALTASPGWDSDKPQFYNVGLLLRSQTHEGIFQFMTWHKFGNDLWQWEKVKFHDLQIGYTSKSY